MIVATYTGYNSAETKRVRTFRDDVGHWTVALPAGFYELGEFAIAVNWGSFKNEVQGIKRAAVYVDGFQYRF